jgi:hypothetical protein
MLLPIQTLAFQRTRSPYRVRNWSHMAKVSWWAEHFYLVVAMFAVAFDPDRNLEVEYGRLMRGSLKRTLKKMGS